MLNLSEWMNGFIRWVDDGNQNLQMQKNVLNGVSVKVQIQHGVCFRHKHSKFNTSQGAVFVLYLSLTPRAIWNKVPMNAAAFITISLLFSLVLIIFLSVFFVLFCFVFFFLCHIDFKSTSQGWEQEPTLELEIYNFGLVFGEGHAFAHCL